MNRPASLKCVTRNIAAHEFYLARGWRVISEGDRPEGPYLLMHFDEAHSLT
ncbi:MAG: hypothetical protein JRH10_07275 [Deltaproteobacteria bacterium]|nr:hypothetical protein [Deltaproteobacteria bacterium]MBW2447019.1 hypothetical protein [Deltaproteobacteria bacterium]